MSDLPTTLREKLIGYSLLSFEVVTVVRSKKTGTIKAALRATQDGSLIEAVLMPSSRWNSVCVSSQVGCGMGCTFCATGKMGFIRQLSAEEILDQVLFYYAMAKQKSYPHPETPLPEDRISHVTFMGMGEPFSNYQNVIAAVRELVNPKTFGISARNISISTSGVVHGIRQLAEEKLPVNLAISLHAPTDEMRSAMMPINRATPIAELMDACLAFAEATHRKVFFEYVALRDKNMSEEDARALALLMRQHHLFHVNIIPYNDTGSGFKREEREHIDRFTRILEREGVPFTVRRTMGDDIAAACGQLITQSTRVKTSQGTPPHTPPTR